MANAIYQLSRFDKIIERMKQLLDIMELVRTRLLEFLCFTMTTVSHVLPLMTLIY